ncbi:MAG: ATP synthase F1 subunit delta [Terriglobia bacterium]|jgi:F-type H+-transporting ATPase subunit delta
MAIAVANRYARALADVVSESGADYRGVLGELQNFLAVYRQSPELREVLETPAIPLEKKIKVLDAVLTRLGAAKLAANFLRVLVRNYRIRSLEEISLAFLKIANERLGVVQVKVFSVASLSDAEQQALRSRFGDVTGKQVEMEFHVDEALLGGIWAQIQSTVYDGSVRGQLNRIREELVNK